MDDSADYHLSNTGVPANPDEPGNQDMFEQMVKSFEAAGMPYCILAGYDEFPQHIPSDIDFMIDPAWSTLLPAIVSSIAKATGAQLIQHLQHETTATTITYLHPDSSGDYRRHGSLWLRAQTVLENRRRHRHGFWIPSAADAFAYYLIKKLDKGSLNRQQATELATRYVEDKENCVKRLHALLPAVEAQLLEDALAGGAGFDAPAWRAVSEHLLQIKQGLHRQALAIPWPDRALQAVSDMRRIAMRCRQPTGLRIVFLGPDGSGKSSVISAVSEQLAQAFRRVEYRHLCPRRRPAPADGVDTVSDPHAEPNRGLLGSFAKLLHFWSGYVIGSIFWLYPCHVRSTLVVFDRFYHDLLADPARYRYGAPLTPVRKLGRLLPQPDMVFILDAPAEVLQLRKQEVSPAESARQRDAYLMLAQEFRHASVIDTTQPLEQVIGNVLAQTLTFLQERSARRLGIEHHRGVNAVRTIEASKP